MGAHCMKRCALRARARVCSIRRARNPTASAYGIVLSVCCRSPDAGADRNAKKREKSARESSARKKSALWTVLTARVSARVMGNFLSNSFCCTTFCRHANARRVCAKAGRLALKVTRLCVVCVAWGPARQPASGMCVESACQPAARLGHEAWCARGQGAVARGVRGEGGQERSRASRRPRGHARGDARARAHARGLVRDRTKLARPALPRRSTDRPIILRPAGW